jgi:hypothetical protein
VTVDGTGEATGVAPGVGAGVGVVCFGVEGVCVEGFCVVDGCCCARALMPSANTYTTTRMAHLRSSLLEQSDVTAIRFLKAIP